MAADYTQDAIDAARDIAENGTEIIYRSVSIEQTYNPETGLYEYSYVDYETSSVRRGIKTQQMASNYIQKPGDMIYLIGGLEIPTPSIADKIISNGRELSVFMFDVVSPGDSVILYKIYVRGDVQSDG